MLYDEGFHLQLRTTIFSQCQKSILWHEKQKNQSWAKVLIMLQQFCTHLSPVSIKHVVVGSHMHYKWIWCIFLLWIQIIQSQPIKLSSYEFHFLDKCFLNTRLCNNHCTKTIPCIKQIICVQSIAFKDILLESHLQSTKKCLHPVKNDDIETWVCKMA